ncbi:hypothetical protein B0H66DRAFT_615570 [Apodospora peruviana]|uniref:Uncharacterized protein n=1 Tax=Apodospora peruviana TaxID=516989 RepID=A0AAE0IH75_9PEZI|nr:hypothetical protein B0H66DRAFT_615570 [Apodospora peruviana]
MDALSRKPLGRAIRVQPTPGHGGFLHFKYVDAFFRPLETVNDSEITWRGELDAAQAYAAAMKDYDAHQYHTIGDYNRAWAIFYAGSLLVHWASRDGPVGSRPTGKKLGRDLVDLKLCRHCSTTAKPSTDAAVAAYKATAIAAPSDLSIKLMAPTNTAPAKSQPFYRRRTRKDMDTEDEDIGRETTEEEDTEDAGYN